MMYCHCKSRKKSMKENDDGFLVICLDRRCLILSPDRPDRCGIAKQHWVLRMFLFGARCLRTPELVIKFRLVFHAMWWTWCRFFPKLFVMKFNGSFKKVEVFTVLCDLSAYLEMSLGHAKTSPKDASSISSCPESLKDLWKVGSHWWSFNRFFQWVVTTF